MLTAAQKFLLNKMNTTAQKVGLGDELDKTKNVLCAKYSYALQGGAVGDLTLVKDINAPLTTDNYAVLPDNAIITKVWIDVLTAPTSGGAATVALKSQSAADLLAATAIASITGILAGVPDDAVANMIKLTADRTVKATVAVAALTAGKFNVYIEYVLGD